MLYGHTDNSTHGSAGATLMKRVQKAKLVPEQRAWDLLSLALATVCADKASLRSKSPDGWTRQIVLEVAVGEPEFWNAQRKLVEDMLNFLSTDIWQLRFKGSGFLPSLPADPVIPDQDSVALLSGGLDSFVGIVDLVADGLNPYAVSQISPGDTATQSNIAAQTGGGLRLLQLNHNLRFPGEKERSQRARSMVFLAYGILVATSLQFYKADQIVDLYVNENGFISINPPLTPTRLGSLSTRTTHPVFLAMFDELLEAANLRVNVKNPYQFKTKGEMLQECKDQDFLAKHVASTNSCSRYARSGWKQCGRCYPCLIRRAAFHAWNNFDTTNYVYEDLSRNDERHAQFDDVRCAAMAATVVKLNGIDALPTTNLNALRMGDLTPYKQLLRRGIMEVGDFLTAVGVK